jgi:hypothetical protein
MARSEAAHGASGHDKVRWRDRIERLTYLKVGISVAALGALVSRMIWPWLKLDAISLGLLILTAVPWVSGLFESLEFPGGYRITFRKLQQAAEAIPDAPSTSASSEEPSYLEVRDLDPQLALVGLRIEIEKRLQRLAELHNIPPGRPAGVLVRELARRDELSPDVQGGLQEVLMAGNAAAHGADLPPGAEDFAFTEGPRILDWLDSLITTRDWE